MYKILAYITAYCDKNALDACLHGISNQSYPVDRVFILDNSPEPLIISDVSCLPLTVKNAQENLGIAFGISEALELAVKGKYDFLWMFDQDSIPAPDCLERLILTFDENVNKKCLSIGIISPTPIDSRTGEIIQPAVFKGDHFEGFPVDNFNSPYQCDSPITSGSLLAVYTADSVAPPDIRLFIDGVDLDYGLRLKNGDYQNIVVPNAILQHTFGTPVELCLFGVNKIFQRYSALRYYYICRNHTYLELSFSKGFYKFTCVLRRLQFLGSQFVWIPMIETENKLQKIWACLRGTYYGLMGDLDQQFSSRYNVLSYFKQSEI
ncbi:glycosyltransferase [Leptothoe spongobia]|nr:glycosyltransferase [Leptothoe spongobia]